MHSNLTSLSATDVAVPGLVPQARDSIRSVVNGIAHEIDLVDVIEVLCIPLFLYLVHGLIEMAKNHVEPQRTLLRPRSTRR
jgi:hypothetical protein